MIYNDSMRPMMDLLPWMYPLVWLCGEEREHAS